MATQLLSSLAMMATRASECGFVEVNLEDSDKQDTVMGGSELGDAAVGAVLESVVDGCHDGPREKNILELQMPRQSFSLKNNKICHICICYYSNWTNLMKVLDRT